MLTCLSTAVRLTGASLNASACGSVHSIHAKKRSIRAQAPTTQCNVFMHTHVALRINFVSWPALITTPYTHPVFLICAPRSNS